MTRVGAALVLAACLAAGQDGDKMSEDEKIVHLLNRLTPGVTPELVAHVRQTGLKVWLERQLKGDLRESEQLVALLKRYETLELPLERIHELYDPKIPKGASPKEEEEIRKKAEIPSQELLAWIILRAVYGQNAVKEVMSDFFRQHFSVSIDKDAVKTFIVGWEREVIYNHALGNFGAMLEASAKHPAMLFYLDNWLSRRPPTPQELKGIEAEAKSKKGSTRESVVQAVELAKQRGLNENYARELLELHTLGVDRFYTQRDVINVALCLTGWTFKHELGKKPQFVFDASMHAPGDKPFLDGKITGSSTRPQSEGEMVLTVLRKHEGTARFLSWKLCRYLVDDEPDDAMMRRVARVWWQTEGDLPRVIKAIVEDPKFFSKEYFRSKFKRPFEFVVSALRATRAEVIHVNGLLAALASMNEALYRCPDPTGYYDQAEAWRDPGAMAYRWTFASDLAHGRIPGVRIPASFYADLPPGRPELWKDLLVAKILPVAGLGPNTSASLDRLIEAEIKRDPRPERLGPVIVAALLGSPEFQKQ